MKICTVVGSRPQFIKAASLSPELRRAHVEILVHTGQHYDYEMSRVFFDELPIPAADYNLGIGSGPHGAQTGSMMASIEQVLITEAPDCVLVIGDTNSTLGGALAAAKLGLRVGHVEAGLRSHRRTMPEEINRVLTDHLATWLFCPTETAVRNLAREGLTDGVSMTGDVLHDTLAQALPIARTKSRILTRLGVGERQFVLATLHRAENTDDRERLAAFARALPAVGRPIVFPVHPRTRAALTAAGLWTALTATAGLRLTDPVGYLDSLRLTEAALVVATDSGGLQREAHALGVPCIVLREETEWVETLEGGTVLARGGFPELPSLVERMARTGGRASRPGSGGGGGGASRRIRRILEDPRWVGAPETHGDSCRIGI